MKTRSTSFASRRALAALIAGCGAFLASGCAVPDDGEYGDDEALPGTMDQRVASSLKGYNVAITDTSVSGLSSGGFFAGQMGVAFSSIIKGVGVVAGGTYDCAGQMGYFSCMYQGNPSVTTSISNTKSWSGSSIDAYSNIANQNIYLFSGSSDTTVATSVMNQVYNYYVTTGGFVAEGRVKYKKDLNTAHTFPTNYDSTGNNACTTAGSPYISNCGFDGAGAILQHIYGPLSARNDGALGGSFIAFDQSEFIASPNSYGMDTTAWLYVPSACASGAPCKLHVALHGCKQNYASIGDKFVKNTGYNRWADTNNIIVMYPQTVVDSTNHSPSPSNAGANNNACWDWVGYYGTDFDRKSGKQMAAVKKMIDRISSGYSSGSGGGDGGAGDGGAGDGGGDGGPMMPPPPATCTTATNYAHVTAGRAHDSLGTAYANGSNQNMGLDNVFYTTTLKQTGANYYVIGTCP